MREPSAADLARLAAIERVQQRLVMLRSDAEAKRFAKAGFGEPDLHAADRAALLGSSHHRRGVYRRLIRATMHDSIAAEIPLAADALGARYTTDVDTFVSEELPRSPLLRDVAFEFVHWAAPRWSADPSVAPWVVDLARLELLEFDSHCGVRSVDVAHVGELPADRPLVFDGTCRIGTFDFAVHELPDDGSPPVASRCGVFLHRDADNRLRRIHLTPIAAAIVTELLVSGRPLAEAVSLGCAAERRAIDHSVIGGISAILEDLVERGCLLGSTASSPPLPDPRWARLARHPAR